MARRAPARELAAFDLGLGGPERPILAGVDEAGRGPLAGPVVAAALILPPGPAIEGIADSKLLTPRQRQRLLGEIMDQALAVGLGVVDSGEIDRINILQASRRAMYYAVCCLRLRPDAILIDGPWSLERLPPGCEGVPSLAVVDGDAKSYAIAAASIVAKCIRDGMMLDYDRRYPQYGFLKHKGYGTREHLAALRRYGPCAIHRRSYAPVRQAALRELQA